MSSNLYKVKNFHIPLPQSTYLKLRGISLSLQRPATQIARDILEDWLKKQKKQSLKLQLAAYVEENAGTSYDLDPQLEAAGVENLLKEILKKKKSKRKSSPQRKK